ncbi:MAG: right-handed parallel beta-helix repeat-containing protein [Phycisphaerales bacterium]|nr:MAG: right-handed parallel beta-helix repeat-containing protein [Phycisphaerales bacterium]
MCCLNRTRELFLLLSCVLMAGGVAHAQTTYYVDDGGSSTTCTSWGDACPDLQTALGLAVGGDRIWVATGTYKPTSGTDPLATFQLKTGVALYGGFDGTETSLGERAGLFDQTVLSGDIGTPDDSSDNSYHVVTGSGTDATAVLDGFTITGGNANGTEPHNRGGGMYNSAGSPTVTNCTFTGNVAKYGGGMCNEAGSSPMVADCLFSGNAGLGGHGGGMANYDGSNPNVVNCMFSANWGGWSGGAVYNESNSHSNVTNCTFSQNDAANDTGRVMANNSASATVTNSVLWHSAEALYDRPEILLEGSDPAVVVTYSLVRDGTDQPWFGVGCLDVDPLFVDPDGLDDTFGTEDDDVHLQPGSPGIDAGHNKGVTVTADLDGNPRIMDGDSDGTDTVDMGAFEYTLDCNKNDIPDVCDIDCAAKEGACNLPGCGQSGDCNGNGVPDQCDLGRFPSVLMENTTGAADGTFTGPPDDVFYGLGNGSVTYDFGEAMVLDLTGPDFNVYEVDYGYPRFYRIAVSVSENDVDYYDVTGSGGPVVRIPGDERHGNDRHARSYDLAGSGLSAARYIRVQGTGNDPPGPTTGFELDAIGRHSASEECNGNNVPDECDIAAGTSPDTDLSGVPDECETPILYVKHDAMGGNNGTSWGDAYRSLQDALSTARNSGGTTAEIWVARGTYTPAEPGGDRGISFDLVNGVAIYGGFAGTETSVDRRNIIANKTILSGDIDGDDDDIPPGPGGGTSGETCAEAGPINDGKTAFDATDATDDGSFGCYAGPDIWYVYTATTTGYLKVSLCGTTSFDTTLAVYEGNATNCPPTTMTMLACNDDSWCGLASEVTVPVVSGNDYLIRVGDLDESGTAGPGVINISYDLKRDNSYHVVTGSGTDATAVLDGFTITGGNADGTSSTDYRGGGMINEEASPTVTNCTFAGNTARLGGGMYNQESSSPTVTNCTFAGNTGVYGGGMFNEEASPTVTNCTFAGNTGENGGGMSNIFGSSPKVTNCTFAGNTGANGGGMSNIFGSSPKVTNCTFSGNEANAGGGMYNLYCSPTVTNCTFAGNTGENGGGMCNYGNDATVTNCYFRGNSADADGGGMFNYGSYATVTNCTFTGNTAANGNAVACDWFEQPFPYPSTVQMANCILWDGGDEIWNNDGSTITITYSDVQDDHPDDGVIYPGTGNIDEDPLFLTSPRLGLGSPCIDAGDDAAVPPDTGDLDGDGDTSEPIPLDLDGNPRFVDVPGVNDTGSVTPPIVDMGAYEAQRCNDDSECDDGRFCNGRETCQVGGAWLCRAGSYPCPFQQCNETNNVCFTPPLPPSDEDGDGVPDDSDACPGTVGGVEVDINGCSCDQLDDDGDGVNNCEDDCPETPDMEAPNAGGCSCSQVDCDDSDACTNDSCAAGDCAHAAVDCDDGDPCTVDSCDGGECVNTAVECPPGQSCDPVSGECPPTDSDGDGVPDAEDDCPGTPLGADVEDDGCRWFSVTLPGGATAIRAREGEEVVVPAPEADEGFRFDHWEGDVPPGREHDDPLTMTLDSDKGLVPVYMQVDADEKRFCGAGAGCTPDAPAVGLIFLGLLGLRFVGTGRSTRGRVGRSRNRDGQ